MEEEHRKRMLALMEKIPHCVPDGWEREIFAVGGLMYIGFSNVATEKLIVISSQGQSIIDCQTWEKTWCGENYDEENLTAWAEPLGSEVVPIAGQGGGGLRRFSPAGEHLELAAPFWPKEQVIFMPPYVLWHQHPERCTVLLDDYRVLAYGFSKCGRYLAVATSSDVHIFKRTGEIDYEL